ncbi:MAG TPA: hypothetical protein VMS38_25060 [Pseudorhodoferax sp.]|nr:hypothetical protein [Pseudorhodoferax sp.]
MHVWCNVHRQRTKGTSPHAQVPPPRLLRGTQPGPVCRPGHGQHRRRGRAAARRRWPGAGAGSAQRIGPAGRPGPRAAARLGRVRPRRRQWRRPAQPRGGAAPAGRGRALRRIRHRRRPHAVAPGVRARHRQLMACAARAR